MFRLNRGSEMGSTRTWIVILVVGVVLEFLVGFCRLGTAEKMVRNGGKRLVLYQKYNSDLPCMVALGSGVLAVLSFAKYCIEVPNWFLAKLVLFAIIILAALAASAIFYGISMIAMIIAANMYERDYAREHKATRAQ